MPGGKNTGSEVIMIAIIAIAVTVSIAISVAAATAITATIAATAAKEAAMAVVEKKERWTLVFRVHNLMFSERYLRQGLETPLTEAEIIPALRAGMEEQKEVGELQLPYLKRLGVLK